MIAATRALDPHTHAEWVVAINEFMQGGREIHGLRCPDNYFTMCHWLIGNYRLGFMAPGWESQSWYTDWWNSDFKLHGELPVVAAVKAMPNLTVDVAKLAVVAGVVLRADNDAPLTGLTVELLVGRPGGGFRLSALRTALSGSSSLLPGVYDLSIPPLGVVRRGVTATRRPTQPVTIRLTGGGSSTLDWPVQSAAGAAAGRHCSDIVARRHPGGRNQNDGRLVAFVSVVCRWAPIGSRSPALPWQVWPWMAGRART